MLLKIEQVITETQVSRTELVSWIEHRWVRPQEDGDVYLFDEMDCARVRLIAELRGVMEVNEGAIPVVLQLLDQVYGLRRALTGLQSVIEGLPPDVQRTIRQQLGKTGDF